MRNVSKPKLLNIAFTLITFWVSLTIIPSLLAKEATAPFSMETLPPASGQKPDSLIVLFHGYGDCAKNFISLGAMIAPLFPNTLFVAFEGPVACQSIPSGRQWFNVSSKNLPALLKEIRTREPQLNRAIDGLLKTHNIPSDKLALVGFSQGARVVMHVGLRRSSAGVVALSGAYLDSPDKITFRPPILIIHGKEDTKAPLALAQEGYKTLESQGVPATLSIIPNLGHEIDPRGLDLATAFLRDCFSGRVSKTSERRELSK